MDRTLNRVLTDYYRCPDSFAGFVSLSDPSSEPGYFRFGQDTTCYGRCSAGKVARLPTLATHDALEDVLVETSVPRLPFDPMEVVDNLRLERYLHNSGLNGRRLSDRAIVRDAYYLVRPLLPVAVRSHLQKYELRGWEKISFPRWPVDRTVEGIAEQLMSLSLKSQGIGRIPFIWFWPEGCSGCAIMTHDIETKEGLHFCSDLMDIDDSFKIKASFQFVPEKRYAVSQDVLQSIRDRGFQINVQDLNHDGQLYRDRDEFLRRAVQMNRYAKEWGATGFRSAVLYRNLDWYDALEFSYDMSVPNVANLDPQRGGCCTVMPYFIGKVLELPLTTIQDYALFHYLNDYSIELWKRQIELILAKHGLVSFIVHPDYIIEERAQNTYRTLLAYLSKLLSERKIWMALPSDVDRWWRDRAQMRMVEQDGILKIEGPGSERARIAYASLAGDTVVYSFEGGSQTPGGET